MAAATALFLITTAIATVSLSADIAGCANNNNSHSTTELTNEFWSQCSTTPFHHEETYDCAHNFLSSLATTARSTAESCQREHTYTSSCHDGDTQLSVFGDVNEYNVPRWNCTSCLDQALGILRDRCYGMAGGHVYYDGVPRCSVRFEIYDFRR